MADMLARINVTETKGVLVVEFTEKRILDPIKIAEIGTALRRLVAGRDGPKLLLDFSNVDFFSSAALGMLVEVQGCVKAEHGQMRLTNVKAEIMQVFELTKLDRVLKFSATREGAMAVLTRQL